MQRIKNFWLAVCGWWLVISFCLVALHAYTHIGANTLSSLEESQLVSVVGGLPSCLCATYDSNYCASFQSSCATTGDTSSYTGYQTGTVLAWCGPPAIGAPGNLDCVSINPQNCTVPVSCTDPNCHVGCTTGQWVTCKTSVSYDGGPCTGS